MRFRRWYKGLRIACGLAMVPPSLWLLVLLVAPTGWARRQIAAQLESVSGRRVALGGLSIGLTGKIHLSDLQIGSPRDAGDPWLKADDVRLDLGLLQMLAGHGRPTRLEVDGVDLRLLRREDGTVELEDLVRPLPATSAAATASSPATPTPAPATDAAPGLRDRVSIVVHRASLTVIDEPTRTRVALRDVEGEGYAQGSVVAVEQLSGAINGGMLRLVARLDRTASALSAEAQFRAEDVALDAGMRALRYIVPVLADASPSVEGRLNADLCLSGQGPSWPEVCRGLAGHGAVSLDRVAMGGAPLLAEIARFADLAGPRRAGSLRASFEYKARRISTDRFTLNVGRLPITLSGWSDLDGRIDYRMRVEGLGERLPDRARRLLADLKVAPTSMTSLSLGGTLDHVVLLVNGVSIDSKRLREPRLGNEDREALRLLGRQLRDRVLR